LKYGINASLYNFKPGEVVPQAQNVIFNGIKVPNKNAVEAAAYISNEQKINEKFSLQYGLRYSTFSNIGKGKSYVYGDESKETITDTIQYKPLELIQFHNGLEPRFSARYEISKNTALKISYMRTMQYLHLVSNSTVSSPLDLWVPADNFIEPIKANQVALGIFKNFADNLIETSIEGFYKHMKDIIDYKDNAELLLTDKIEKEVFSGNGYSFGAEFLVRKNTGKFTGWISYTLSRTRRQANGINDNKEYAATHDRTHNVNVVASYSASNRVELGLNWTYNTGIAVTFPAGKFVYEGNLYPFFTERNGYRMPAYHRMDMSATLKRKNHETKKLYYEWNFSVYNVYYRKNPFSIIFEVDNDATVAKKIYLFAIVPSISWNFKF
jgi:outer membrane receptor protein involved in Fe transport